MKPSPGPISDWVRTPDGRLLLADEFNHRILIEEPNGRWRIGSGAFRYPRSLAVLGSAVYVVDSWNHRVQAFQLPEWKFAFEFGRFFCPSSIAVLNNFLVIADTNNCRLAFHRPNGSFAFAYELNGFPRRVHAAADGTLTVRYDNGGTEKLEY